MTEKLLKTDVPLSPELQSRLGEIISKGHYRKGEFLLRKGKINDKIWYVQKGLLRRYILSEDKDHTTGFHDAGSFALSISSFYSQTRSEEFLQAVEPTTAFHVTYQELTLIAECHPELYKFIALTLPNYLQDVEICCQILRGASAIERYNWLRDNKSNLFNRAAGKHMASFLAMTPETFSKIRSQR
jgi:CRP/FNR family transcriptional regulator, anaerobic regulatory protein